MGFEPAIQSLSQISGPGTFGIDNANPKSAGGCGQAFTLAAAQTPEEALAYIRQLTEAGRTDELVGLLRLNPAFREAWQTLQQSAAAVSETGGKPAALPAPDASGLPSPSAQTAPTQLSGPDLASFQVAATPEISSKAPVADTYPVPAPKPARGLAAGLQAYACQQRNYLDGLNPQSRFSFRV